MSDKTAYLQDRLIIAAPILIALAIATAVIFVARLHFVGQMFALSIAAAFATGLSLTPTVGRARMRLLRRKYPPEERQRTDAVEKLD